MEGPDDGGYAAGLSRLAVAGSSFLGYCFYLRRRAVPANGATGAENRQPGMMTLISLAISVVFVYSVATLFIPGQKDFLWIGSARTDRYSR